MVADRKISLNVYWFFDFLEYSAPQRRCQESKDAPFFRFNSTGYQHLPRPDALGRNPLIPHVRISIVMNEMQAVLTFDYGRRIPCCLRYGKDARWRPRNLNLLALREGNGLVRS